MEVKPDADQVVVQANFATPGAAHDDGAEHAVADDADTSAEDGGSPGELPMAYVQRPLTLPALTLAPRVSFAAARLPVGTSEATVLFAAISASFGVCTSSGAASLGGVVDPLARDLDHVPRLLDRVSSVLTEGPRIKRRVVCFVASRPERIERADHAVSFCLLAERRLGECHGHGGVAILITVEMVAHSRSTGSDHKQADRFLPLHAEARVSLFFPSGGHFTPRKIKGHVFAVGGVAQVHASVPVKVCDLAKTSGDTGGCSEGRLRNVDAYQLTGPAFVGFGGGVAFPITEIFGVAAETAASEAGAIVTLR